MNVDLKGKKVALIGGAGFIGHHLALKLQDLGADVHVVDGLGVNHLLHFTSEYGNVPHRELYLRMLTERLDLMRARGIPVHVEDARDYLKLSMTLGKIQPQAIVHLAAISHAGRSNKDPYSTFDHSLRTLENALDYARNGVEHFVYFSSSMAYGNFLTEEVDEDHPMNPIGIYGALKLAGEKMVIAYQQVFDLPYTIVRPSALYGPRCVSRRVGQIFIENALLGEPLRVDGDGSERLDFTCIDDLVQGILLVLDRPAARNQIFNLTYGGSRSIQDLVEIIRSHFPAVEVKRVERDHLMPFRGTLSVARARELLGYAPANPIEIGFGKYVDWYRGFWKGK
ncbi:MAG: NAD(P)-dependent oxidoreductase [Armatimonadetes bacterium]|nr:NAD(P)-dependent oxidoreductase [Armatimonadota bacterium]